LTFPEFVKQIVALRPEKAASVMDVADLRYCLQNDVTNMRHIAEELLSKVEGAQAALVKKLELVVTSLDTLDGRLKASEAKGGS
jgi:hypothetical protein